MRLDRRALLLLLLPAGGCYEGEVQPDAPLPSRYDSPTCHVEVLAAQPSGSARPVGRVRVFANLEQIDRRWAVETLARHACALGGDAIVLRDRVEAPPPRTVRSVNNDVVTFEADAFRRR